MELNVVVLGMVHTTYVRTCMQFVYAGGGAFFILNYEVVHHSHQARL